MSSNRIFFRAACLALIAAPLALPACTSDWGVSPMPTGYKFTNAKSYSVPGNGPAPSLNYPGVAGVAAPQDAQPASGGDVATGAPMPVVDKAEAASAPTATPAAPAVEVGADDVAWNDAAKELLDGIEKSFGRIKDAVYVREALPGRSDEAAFAAALASELAGRNYKAGEKDKAPFSLDYMIVGQAEGSTLISLTAYAQGKQIARQDGRFARPGPDGMAKADDKAIPVLARTEPSAPGDAQTENAEKSEAAASSEVQAKTQEKPVSEASSAEKAVEAAPPALTVEEGSISKDETADESETPRTYIYGRGQRGQGRTAYEERMGDSKENIVIAAPEDESPEQ